MAEGFGGALERGAGAGDEREVARHGESADVAKFEGAEFEFLGDGAAGDEADAESGFDGGLDGLGGIEVHDGAERFQFAACFFEGRFDHVAGTGTLFAHQETGGAELWWREVDERGRGRDDEDKFVAHEGLDVNTALASGTFDESDGGVVIEDELDDFFGIAAAQGELDARVLVEEGSDEARENVLSDGGGNAEGEFAGEVSGGVAEVLLGLGCKRGEFGGVTKQDLALRRERNAIGGTVEKADAEIVFEGLDLECDRGLGEEEMLGSFAEVEVFGDRAEHFETEVLELRHGEIVSSCGWSRLLLPGRAQRDTENHQCSGLVGKPTERLLGDPSAR